MLWTWGILDLFILQARDQLITNDLQLQVELVIPSFRAHLSNTKLSSFNAVAPEPDSAKLDPYYKKRHPHHKIAFSTKTPSVFFYLCRSRNLNFLLPICINSHFVFHFLFSPSV